jgi:hypothetical protein
MYKKIFLIFLLKRRDRNMNTNTYLGWAFSAYLSIASPSLLAEAAPVTDIPSPETSAVKEPLEPSEAQRQQEEHHKGIITVPEKKLGSL